MNRFEIILALMLWVLGSARLVRLLLFDSYPPVAWLRDRWDRATSSEDGYPGSWTPLLHCAYCAAPYVTLLTGVVSLWLLPASVPYSHAQTWFWLTAGWAAASYAAAIAVAYDGDD